MKRKTLPTAVGFLPTATGLCIVLLSSISLVSGGVPDNEGTEFIFAFGSNYENSGGTLEVFVTTRKAGPVTFSYTHSGTTQSATVSAGDVFEYQVSSDERMTPNTGATVESKAQIITADDEVIVYASNKQDMSADAFLALPTDILGTDYVVPGWETNIETRGGSMILISPVEDNTQVTITLRGSQIDSFTLNRGQVYQYLMPYTSSGRRKRDVLKRVKRGGKKSNKSNKSTKTTTTPSSSGACSISASISSSTNDITGARIQSDKPIAVMSGNRRCYIGTIGSSDHIVEMIPPVNTLGREFLLSNFFERKCDPLRIISKQTLPVFTQQFNLLIQFLQ